MIFSGILTLCKGGASNVRLYSATNQKASQAGSSLPGTSAVNEGQKSRGFFLTKISSSKLNEASGSLAIAGRVMTSSKITIPDDAKKQTAVITSSSPGTISQTPLNLQGISASRAVPFGTSRPTTVMLLSSTVTATTSTTTTTISSGGLKTTKSIIGLKPTLEGTRLIKDAKFTIISSEERIPKEADSMTDLQGSQGKILSEYNSDTSLIDITENDGKNIDPSGLVFNTVQPSQEIPTDVNTLESESNSEISSKPTKTIVLGTKVIASSSNQTVKPNITFINSKTLNKVFSTSEPLQIKPFMKSNTGCTLIKVPQKGSSIRLVRSVGGTRHPFPALKGSKGNIVTKTFTINTKPLTKSEGLPSKRRISLDSSPKNVTKRSRGTSTDNVPEGILSNTDEKDESKSKFSKPEESSSQIESLDENCVSYSKQLEKNISVSKSSPITSIQQPKENLVPDPLSVIGKPNKESLTYTVSSAKPNDSEELASFSKVKSPSKGQLISQCKDTLNTSIKVTKELLTSSLMSEDIILPPLTKSTQADDTQETTYPTTDVATQKIECDKSESSSDAKLCENIDSVAKIDSDLKPKDLVTPITSEPVVLVTSAPNIDPDISQAKEIEEKSKSESLKQEDILNVSKFYTGASPSFSKKLTTETPEPKSKDSSIETRNEVSEQTPHKSDQKTETKDIQSASHRARRDSLTLLKGASSSSKGQPNRVTRSTIKTISKSQKRRLRSSI